MSYLMIARKRTASRLQDPLGSSGSNQRGSDQIETETVVLALRGGARHLHMLRRDDERQHAVQRPGAGGRRLRGRLVVVAGAASPAAPLGCRVMSRYPDSGGSMGSASPLIPLVGCLILASASAYSQATDTPSFEVATVKLSSAAKAIHCSGGPGTTSPGIWRCANIPLAFLITRAYSFEAYQFSPRCACCQARVDVTAKVPEGATKEQFAGMLQNLLVDRFQLALIMSSGRCRFTSLPWRRTARR